MLGAESGGSILIISLNFIGMILFACRDSEYTVLYGSIAVGVEFLLVVAPAAGYVIAVLVELPVAEFV